MKNCSTCEKELWRGNQTGYCVQCLGLIRSGENNVFYGKKHTDVTRNKMKGDRPSITGSKNPRYKNPHSEKTKQLISEKAKQRLKDRPELLEQLRQNGVKSSLTSYRITKPQRIVQNYLNTLKVHYKINGLVDRYSYDFILQDVPVIIEVHGTYWHGDPRVYGKGKIELTERQLFKIEQDKIKKKLVEDKGYFIYYIWETEIKNNDFTLIDKIYEQHKLANFRNT